MHSLYYAFISCSDADENGSSDTPVELYITWAWSTDIAEHSPVYPTGVFSGIQLRKHSASTRVANNNCIGDVSRDRIDSVPHLPGNARCG